MEYLKIFTDFARSIEPLDDAERGRLFSAMMAYADHGEVPELSGNERFIWPTARLHIDREIAFCEKQRANARREKQQSQTEGEQAKGSQKEPRSAKASQISHKDKEKEKDKENFLKKAISH